MSLRSKHHRKARIARLHQAARHHIAKDGVQGLRLNTLAKELGYTSAALYRYYPSKESLISELQKESLFVMHRSLLQCLTSLDAPSPLAHLLLCTDFYIEYASNSPASFALNSSIFSNPSILLHGEKRAEIIQAMKALLLVIQRHLVDVEVVSSEDNLSRSLCLWSSLHGVLLTRKYQQDFPVPCPRDFVSTLLLGWGIPYSNLHEAQQLLAISSLKKQMASFTHLDSLEVQ